MELKQLLKHMSHSFTASPKQARRRPSKPIDNTLATIDHLEERVLLAADYGDAPDSSVNTGRNDYQTTALNNGPRHTIDATRTTLFLGASVDGDLGLNQSRAAVLDDLFSAGGKDDEDGVLNALDLTSTVGANAKVTLSATNRTAKAATLYGWIDFNQNGIFENATERASIAVPRGTTAGRFTLTFPTTPAGSLGATYARFRLSTDAAAAHSVGPASDGEVEDYPFEVKSRVNFRYPHLSYSVMSDAPAVTPTSFFGATTAPVGDLDGDGVIDMAVGAPGENEQAGAVYVIFRNTDGSAKSSVRIASQLNGGPALTPNEYFGASMEPLGDIDGDGVDDLAIGSLGTSDKGAVYICRLKPDGTIKSFTKLASGINGFPVVPNNARAGVIAPIGDIDNDGVRDIAIGAPGIAAGGSDRGAIYIVRLLADGRIKSFTTIANTATWNPDVADDNQFGSRIASLGDLDRDGTQELAVLSEASTEYGSISTVHVLSLKNDGTLLRARQSIDELRSHPGIPFDIFGMNPVGDVNGDGINDLVISGNVGSFSSGSQISIATLNSDGSIGRVLQIPSYALPYYATYLSGVSVLQNPSDGGDLQLILGMPFQWSLNSPSPGVAVVTIDSAPANTQPPETPKNPAPTGVTNSFTFDLRWDDNPSVHEYLVWLRNDTTGEVLLNSEPASESFLRYDPGFRMGSYSFSVRAKNELGLSPWSPTVRFTVNASPVIQPTPDGMNRRPRIDWTELPIHSYVRSYEIVVTNVDSGVTVIRQSDVRGSAWIPETDLPDGKYKVWVRGITPDGLKSIWSAADEFVIRTTTRITNITRTFLTEPYIDVTEVPGVQYYEAAIHNLSDPSTLPVRRNLGVVRTYQGVARLTTSALPSAEYRIWVRAIGKDGSTGAWSAPRDFQSDVPPVLNSVPERLEVGTNLVLTWSKVDVANYYVLGGVVSSQSLHAGTTTNSYVLRAMPQGRYRVYLRAEQRTSLSSIPDRSRDSEAIEWIVTGNISDLRLENDFRDPSLRELKWKAIPGVIRYEISFDDAAEDKTVAAIVSGNKYALPRSIPAEASTVYVRGISEDGTTTEWSAGFDVNQTREPELKPVEVDSLYTRRFSWEPVPNATGYDVLIRHVDSHKYLPGWYNVQETEVVAEKLLEGRYEWTVRPRGIPGESLWSPLAEHMIDRAPVLSVPVAFEALDASKLVQWSAIDGAEFYDFWITDYTNKTIIREPRYSQLEYDLKSKLSPGEYYTYVRVVTGDGQFLRWGQPRRFTIKDQVWPYLTVPTSFQASEQEKLIDWQDIPGASLYEIWITNERFVRVVHQTQIESSSFDLGSSLGVGRYRVWVRALNGLGITGGWSSPAEFSIV